MKKNKILLKILAAAISCLLISTASFAYFTDRASTSATGVAGTLSMEVDSILGGKEILYEGKTYNISPFIRNTGSKSADIRLVYRFNTDSPNAYDSIMIFYQGMPLTDTEGGFDGIHYKIERNNGFLTYYIETTLNGSLETEPDAASTEFNKEFSLQINNLEGASFFDLEFQAFAKQHRNTSENSWELIEY